MEEIFGGKLREGVKKKNCEKAVRLTAWVDVFFKHRLKVKSVLGIKESYSMEKKGLTFSQIVLVRLEGGDPPPQSGQPDRFFAVFFYSFP